MDGSATGDSRTMSGRILLIAALTAPALVGCVGLGLGENATQNPVVSAPPQTAVPYAADPRRHAAVVPAAPGATPVATASPPPPAIPTGAALGGVLGGPVGATLTDADRQSAWQAQIAALDSGQRRSWRGAHGVFGFVEPGAETGAGCRTYAQTIYVAGRPNRGQGVACKQPDGGWRMTS